jgi:phage-related baseplate assembly protein
VAVSFTITDPTYYERELIRTYEELTGRTLNPADPERLLINLKTYALTLLAIAINETAKQNLLAYAKGENLDRLAEFYGVKRLPPKPAITTLRFSVDEPLPFDVVVPEGTKATPDGKIVFETIQEVRIPAGELSVEVQAVCTQSGSIGNGFAIGQINKLVDPIPYITKVENTTMSMYGTDEEDDERFRERIRLSIERFTNAGSREAYIYHTKTAHQDIEDVSVFSPQPGQVKVVFLLRDGQLPDAQMIDLVSKHLNGEKVRPLTDQVIVEAPQVVNYNIAFTYYIHKKDTALVSQIQQKVNQAVQDFVNWTKTKIGRDVLPEELIRRAKEAGAYRVSLTAPSYAQVAPDQVAHAQSVSVTYGGLVDD